MPSGAITAGVPLGIHLGLSAVLFAVAYLAGMPLRIFGILALAGILIAPIAWKFALQDYQKERISTFLNPEQDARGAGYQEQNRSSVYRPIAWFVSL